MLFFDYIGVLVALGVIPEDIVVGVMGAPMMQVWRAMSPAIKSERTHRLQTYPADVSPGFLVYFEHLVTRIHELGGRNSAKATQQRIGVRQLPEGWWQLTRGAWPARV